jgi:ectoine hydroxylase-related dioxygenase (phytanoyl-CoA dioxygenase family)
VFRKTVPSFDVTPDRHPWNTTFAWEDRSGPFLALSAEQVRSYDEQGFVVVPDLVPAPVLAEITAEIDAIEAEVEQALRANEGGRVTISEAGAITFSVHLVERSSVLRSLVADPALADIAADLIGPDVRLYWDQAVYKKPEKPRRFPWHQDNGYAFVEPQQYLTIWLALTDATVANGCPQVVPGLHRMGTLRHHYVDPLGWECLTDPDGVVAAPVPAGGAVVFSSLTPHMTGPNTTDAVRKAYIVQYAPHGAVRLDGDPRNGPPERRTACDAPGRQFPVVVGGRPIDPPPSAAVSAPTAS